eukprot:347241-Chlamydomonas_euryale.AAC.8
MYRCMRGVKRTNMRQLSWSHRTDGDRHTCVQLKDGGPACARAAAARPETSIPGKRRVAAPLPSPVWAAARRRRVVGRSNQLSGSAGSRRGS